MAIYSLHHSSVGKSTQAQPYTASAHIRYIARSRALSHLEASRMPATKGQAASWLRRGEDRDRKNGRVIDKVLLALPKELAPAQRHALVRAFAEAVTMGRASWLAAFHDKGKDASNPHCHLVLRDRDPATGKRVIGMSEAGSTERLRELWEVHANQALEQANRSERIDRRTLKAQGIHREPTIHEGVRAQQMHRRGARAKSRRVTYRNGKGARRRTREINYERLDRGHSRPAYNQMVRAQPRETERDFWLAVDASKRNEEFELLRRIHRPSQEPTRAAANNASVVDFWLKSGKDEALEPDLER